MNIEYEPYHVHTYYSNCLTQLDSITSVKEYADEFKSRGHKTLCLLEHGNRSNAWEQFSCGEKNNLIPIAAAECYFVPDRNPELKDRRNFHLVLIAKNMKGFKQLNKIISEANISGYYYRPRIDYELISSIDRNNFICTTACIGGILKDENAEDMLINLKNIFQENLYLEIQHHPQKAQVELNKYINKLYSKYHIPLIYGSDSHYIHKNDKYVREEFLKSGNINYGDEDSFDLYLPTVEESYNMFINQGVFSKAKIEEAFENTLILREFDGLHFDMDKKIPCSRPELSYEERVKTYKDSVKEGYLKKEGIPSKEDIDQLNAEMDAVCDTGTADYFIAMKDIVEKGIQHGGILTTTGRGSGVSFATNYALGFTSINRLKCPVKLYPDRFISKERLASGALPDLDLNMSNVEAFEQAGKEILGEFGCLPMVAFGTAKNLSAFKMLARARNISFEISNQVSSQISKYDLDIKYAKLANQDDIDYNPEDDIKISKYVSEEYIPLINDSKIYTGIITNISPHPCAHLLLDKDIREEIGVVMVKSKSGSKEPVLCAYIDGQTADMYGYLKADYLKVDVVKTINAAFNRTGNKVMSVNELLDKVKDDKEIWSLFEKGFTMGLNQCERDKTTERVKEYKPRNVVELAAFVAAVRPGFKSMVNTFISRNRFSYGIKSLDSILQTKEIPDSFLMYDEQILSILQSAGIPASDAYVCVKAIKKKKADKVASFKERFKKGFMKILQEKEGATEEEAFETVEKVWTIINDAASYMFCAAHAYSMACDCLYSAYLKVHYPFEFYASMLKLYDEKGNKEKIASIINEMNRYKGIKLIPGLFGEDNRDWFVNKENNTISQSLSSIKNISKSAADDLCDITLFEQETFSDILYYIRTNTCINRRQIDTLIGLNYFKQFGNIPKLTRLENEFYEGKNRITTALRESTRLNRLQALKKIEANDEDEDVRISKLIRNEYENIGLCLSKDSKFSGCFMITELDDKFGIKLKLYNIAKGLYTPTVKISKQVYQNMSIKEEDIIQIKEGDIQKRKRYIYNNGTKTAVDNAYDFWLTDCKVINKYEKQGA